MPTAKELLQAALAEASRARARLNPVERRMCEARVHFDEAVRSALQLESDGEAPLRAAIAKFRSARDELRRVYEAPPPGRSPDND